MFGLDFCLSSDNIVNVENQAFSTSDDNTESGTIKLETGSLIALLIIANNTLKEAQNGNASVYFIFPEASGDGFDHVKQIGDRAFGFEDLVAGGDQDFNDIVITLDSFSV